MFDGPAPRLYTIASGAHFLDILAATLLDQADRDPFKLSQMRVLLPTRRAGRSLAEAFVRKSGAQALILPRILPLGDIDEDEVTITESGVAFDERVSTPVPPAMPGLSRQLTLARLIMAIPTHRLQPEQAAALARELGSLLDRLDTEDCDPALLKTLAPEDFANHWQEVMAFLSILVDQWPQVTEAAGVLDTARRRNLLLRTQAALWKSAPPATPIIAAGSTGSIPATADLLEVIATLPQGAVILPGLDREMPDAAWRHVGPTHPQYGLKQLLSRLGVSREDVVALGPDPSVERARVLSLALRPARAPELPSPSMDTVEQPLAPVTRLDCAGPSEEATTIALLMRHTLETPEKTCALVTPDRDLARRVAAALKRWNIVVDDSAGQPLDRTPPGTFLRLVAAAAADDLAPVALLAVLKHPLAAAGQNPTVFRGLVRSLEETVLHGPRPSSGISGLRAALDAEKKRPPASLYQLLDTLSDVFSPLIALMRQKEVSFDTLLQAHVGAAEALATSDTETGTGRLWRGDAGEALAGFVTELIDGLTAMPPLPPRNYAGFFETLMLGRAVRPQFGTHPRLFIWGLLEARLQHADTMILGGLNEATWPQAPDTNPWMSRQMMATIGLDAPERRTGLTAHDFQQAFSAPTVYLTRAARVGGAPTVPSRWLLRLDNLLQRTGVPDTLAPAPEDAWVAWAEHLDSEPHRPPLAPRPKPPLDARPKALSVTRIETLIRDPYAIYAKQILNLNVLDPIDADPGAADRGSIIHDALDAFVRAYPDTLPDNAYSKLLEYGRIAFADQLARPGVRAFWWPRFERIAAWFVDWQRERLEQGWRVKLAEEFGDLTIDAIDGGFRVFAKPDRIDYRADLGLAILDYKTGQPPSAKQVASGLAPQLPLEAAIAAAGGFEGVPAEPSAQLLYVHLSGGRQPGRAQPLKLDVSEATEVALQGVKRLVTKFADPRTPYLSRPRPQFENRFSDYDHLARVQAWGADGDGSE